MSELDLTFVALEFDRVPNWMAAVAAIDDITPDQIEAAALEDEADPGAVLEHDLRLLQAAVSDALEGHRAAELTTLSFRGYTLFLTGGEGDASNDLYFSISRLKQTEILDSAGFDFGVHP